VNDLATGMANVCLLFSLWGLGVVAILCVIGLLKNGWPNR